MADHESLKELERLQKSLYPDIYEFDKSLVDDLEELMYPLQEQYERSDRKNPYLNKVNKTQSKFYDSIMKNESKHLDLSLDNSISILDKLIDSKIKETKVIKNNDYSKKEKILYYSKRVNNTKLTHGQRLYAEKRISELR